MSFVDQNERRMTAQTLFSKGLDLLTLPQADPAEVKITWIRVRCASCRPGEAQEEK